MYSIALMGAIVVDIDGEPLGIVQAIEHNNEGARVIIFTGDEEEPKMKEPAPGTISKLRSVATGGDK